MAMKKISRLILVGCALMALGTVSCELQGKEGPAGAAGTQGPAGEKGDKGEKGDIGLSGGTSCVTCHASDTRILARSLQWSNSGHATMADFDRSQKACAMCHTNEGFQEFLSKGTTTLAADIVNPTPQNCRTCHKIHNNYDSTDFNLRVSSAIKLRAVDTTTTVDFGSGNTCATCHQFRLDYKIPALTDTSINVASTRWGMHYGTQAPIFSGKGGVQIPGAVAYENSAHTTMAKNACVTCHMATAIGNKAGGHSLIMEYDREGTKVPNLAGCKACHDSTLTSFNYKGKKDEISALLDTLKSVLNTKGAVDTAGVPVKNAKQNTLVAAAIWNYLMVKRDGSYGVHNYKYSKALLSNAIDTLKKLP